MSTFWAVYGYLPMANAMATLREFPIVLVATNHEDESLPNVEVGGSVVEVREGQTTRPSRSAVMERLNQRRRGVGRSNTGITLERQPPTIRLDQDVTRSSPKSDAAEPHSTTHQIRDGPLAGGGRALPPAPSRRRLW